MLDKNKYPLVSIIMNCFNGEFFLKESLESVINFSPKQIGPFMSDCLVLGFPDRSGEVTLITTDQKVPNGGKLF